MCEKLRNRSFLDFFTVYNCDKCNEYYDNNYVYVGNNTINIITKNNCINKLMSIKTIKLLLKDAIINQDKTLLWLDDIELERAFDYLALLLCQNDLYVINL